MIRYARVLYLQSVAKSSRQEGEQGGFVALSRSSYLLIVEGVRDSDCAVLHISIVDLMLSAICNR